MEKFQEWRDQKAEELKSIEDHLERKRGLKEMQGGAVYEASRWIHVIKSKFPENFEKAEELWNVDYSAIETSQDWEVKDVSGQIPDGLKILFELRELYNLISTGKKENLLGLDLGKLSETLLKEIGYEGGKEHKGEYKEYRNPIQLLANKLTGGAYFDLRNYNHVVGAMPDCHQEIEKNRFDVTSLIKTAEQGSGHPANYFWFRRGPNPWLSRLPLMIMTPYSKGGRELMKTAKTLGPLEHKAQLFLANVSGLVPNYELDGETIHFTKNKPLQTGNFGMSRRDVFDVMLDLRKGKVFKRKVEGREKKLIDGDIKKFRQKFFPWLGPDANKELQG